MRSTPTPRLPSSFRGEVHYGDSAARKASLVSGPFSWHPLLYARPRTRAELALLIRWARSEGVSLIPRGGGTGMPGGNLGPGAVVDLTAGFSELGPVDRERGRIQAGAATVAQRIQDRAGEAGFFLPPLPASSRWCTVGGMAANNAAGARSFLHGAVCRWVTALEGVDARGEPFRVESSGSEGAGHPLPEPFATLDLDQVTPGPDGGVPGWPAVRKNSSGYALDRFLPTRDPVQLLVGSEGTLAVITQVELRLAPSPRFRGLAVLRAEGPEELDLLRQEAVKEGTATCDFLGRRLLEMAELERDPEVGALVTDAYALLLLEVEGSRERVEEAVRRLTSLSGAGGRGALGTTDPATMDRLWKLRHRASPLIAREADRGRISTQFIEDCVVPPERLAEYLRGVEGILEANHFDAVIFGHAGDGNVHVNPLVDVGSPDWEDRVRKVLHQVCDLVGGLGGTLAGEHGDGRLRAPLLPRIWPEALVQAFGAVKKAFDPHETLNPGVILPVPGQDPLGGFRPRPRTFP